jgi:hypothetical protein
MEDVTDVTLSLSASASKRSGTISCGKGDNFRECTGAAVRQARYGLMLHLERRRTPMLDRLSDDEVSRQILGVFMRHRIPASGVLQRNHFFQVRDCDFQRGINKAVANNWIRIDQRNRYRYQLTATGYDGGRMIDPVLGQPT